MKTLSIDVSDNPITLAGGQVAIFEVHTLSISEWCGVVAQAQMRDTMAAANRARRAAQRAIQIRAYSADGTRIETTADELLLLPRKLFTRLTNAADDARDDSKPGKIIGKGDGIDTPIRYQLGTSIAISANSNGGGAHDASIIELEFQARTGLEIEDVLCEQNIAEQTRALIEKCAKPIVLAGNDIGLSRLPSWAFDKITLADFLMIAEKVLPSFLE